MENMKRTTEQFVKEAEEVHGERYDYSLVNYERRDKKVKIICSKHGVFEQLPFNHLKGCGCPECAKEENANKCRKTKEQFVKEARLIYGDKYDYSETNYINAKTKVKIFCNTHQQYFYQSPDHFLRGRSCPICSQRVTDLESFVRKANNIHGNKYDYSLVKYTDTYSKIKIICKTCGKNFEQKMNNHLNGQGCPYCWKYNTESFIKEANKIHNNKYNYSLVNYVGSFNKVKIVCPKHGIFEQAPSAHLQGSGCLICNESKGEKEIRNFLESKNIIFEEQKTFPDLKDKYVLRYDFYIPSKNLLIEYNGKQHYKPVKYFGGRKQFLLQKHHDWLKRKYAQKNNLTLITISYQDDIKSKLILYV